MTQVQWPRDDGCRFEGVPALFARCRLSVKKLTTAMRSAMQTAYRGEGEGAREKRESSEERARDGGERQRKPAAAAAQPTKPGPCSVREG